MIASADVLGRRFDNLVLNFCYFSAVPPDQRSMSLTSHGDSDVKGRRVLRELRYCHGIDRLARNFDEIETIKQTSDRDPNIHLTNFPTSADSAA